MDRIQSARKALAAWSERVTSSPRASTLWAVIIFIVVLAFIAQVVGGAYVYNIVRLGLDDYRTNQEKKIDAELRDMLDKTKLEKVHEFVLQQKKTFSERIDTLSKARAAQEQEVKKTESTEVKKVDTTPEKKPKTAR
jgi:hypothetical protein